MEKYNWCVLGRFIKMTREDIIRLLDTNDRAIERAVVAISARQTEDERRDEVTKYHNGKGWRPCHAAIGVSMAKYYERNQCLSPKQIAYWRTPNDKGIPRIHIYAGQLLKIAMERQLVK